MTLRNKTVVIITIALTCLIVILYAVSKTIIMGGFSKLETLDTTKNVGRAINAIQSNIATLNSEAADWAACDDTCSFVEGSNGDYVKKNLSDETMSVLKINIFIITDNTGKIIYGKGYDLESKKETPLPEGIAGHLSENSLLATHTTTASSVSGLLALPGNPLMLASRPILTSKREGPIRGTLIMGRYLNSAEIKRLGETTELSLAVQPANDSNIPPGLKNTPSSLSMEPTINVLPVSQEIVAGYTLINDIYGKPGLLLKLELPRSIYKQGRASILYFIFSILAAGVIFGLINLLLLEKTVLSRLKRLSASVSTIGSMNDHTARVEVTGRDELCSLGEAVNGMLEALDLSRKELVASEVRYRNLVENSPDLIFSLNRKGEFTYVNQWGWEHLDFNSAVELLGKHCSDFIHPDDRVTVKKTLIKLVSAGIKINKGLSIRLLDRNGKVILAELNASILYDDQGNYKGIFGTLRDITERKRVEEELTLQKAYFQQLFDNSPEGIAMLDENDVFITANKGFEKLFQYTAEEIKDKRVNDVIVPESFLEEASAFSQAVYGGQIIQAETIRMRKDGSQVNVLVVAYSILLANDRTGMYVIYSDITERKKTEEQLKYLSMHDPLTGLHNRAYFEQEMKRLQGGRWDPVSVLLCDVDGLKLVNDTMGHDVGDTLLVTAARIIKNAFRESDMVARIGGDEFAVLLPDTDKKAVLSAAERVRDAITDYNSTNPDILISISKGYVTGSTASKKMSDLFKEADNNMYREKLLRSQSTRSSIVQTLMKAMEARDFITEGHADRLQDLVSGLAKTTGLSERNITDLRLLAKFHDIGKVGIPDRILFKPGPLSSEEKSEMLRHSEIGHRIAQSAPDLAHIADWILKHHEWWNGKGYPLELKGEAIPLECRILAIADAYDAMTNNRPYRMAMTHQDAVKELLRCSGTQFDPLLVSMFLRVLETNSVLG
ncbi:MAG: PAS domain S-box protein [Actinobacteria bacterium]|nr:PAS domain S-box protein [Actinomycetota bacterium]